jgi:hypothetical protein
LESFEKSQLIIVQPQKTIEWLSILWRRLLASKRFCRFCNSQIPSSNNQPYNSQPFISWYHIDEISSANAVMRLGNRVEQLESTISMMQGPLGLSDHAKPQTPSLPWNHSQPSTPFISISKRGGSYPSPPASTARHVNAQANLHVISDTHRCEWHLGPTSLAALMYDMNESVLSPLQEPESSEELGPISIAFQSLNLLAGEEEQLDLVQDMSTLKTPPPVILDALIDPYFDTINSYFPIWTKESFLKLRAASKDNPQNMAYTVCSNNLILLTLLTEGPPIACREFHSANAYSSYLIDGCGFDKISPRKFEKGHCEYWASAFAPPGKFTGTFVSGMFSFETISSLY